MRRSALILGLLLMIACGAPPPGDSSTSGITTVNPDASSSSSGPLIQTVTSNVSQADVSGSMDDSASTTGSTDATSVFTSGDHPDFGDSDGPVGCGGKIDFLFLISRRAHMAPKQAALSASLPGFISTIKSKFDDFDVHIMVVGAEPAGWGIAACEEACWDNNLQSCEPDGPSDYPCWAYAGNELTACDQAFGAGVTFPAGFQSTNERCDLAGGNRYIIDEEPDLVAAFECVSRLGVLDKNGTLPGLAIEYALSPESLGPGGCNEGFIRDDALLVLTIVTDGGNFNDPEAAAEHLVALKGDEQSIVTIGLVPDSYLENNVCGEDPGEWEGWLMPINEFFTLLPNMIWGSCCLDDYVPVFNEGVELVLEICETFIPQ